MDFEIVNKVTKGVIERFGRQSNISNQSRTSRIDLRAQVKTKAVITREFGGLKKHDFLVEGDPPVGIHA